VGKICGIALGRNTLQVFLGRAILFGEFEKPLQVVAIGGCLARVNYEGTAMLKTPARSVLNVFAKKSNG
jgi:hypothetical protein